MIQANNPEPPLLLTSRDAAKLLSISTRTLFKLRDRGDIKALKIPAIGLRYSRAEIEDFVNRAR